MAGAGVTPQQIYNELLAAGASTTQAIGIMANMLAESDLSPESVNRGDPNGGSYGLAQQNGGQYATLVSNNPAADMAAQIRVLAQNGGIAAASGTSPAAAAGNFSANYEKCTQCQPGQASYNQRVANAATVASWVATGKWPTSAGSATAAAGTGTGLTGSADPTCAWGISGSVPGLSSLPLVGGAFSASLCFLHKKTIRHVVGGLVLLASSGAVLVGALILAAAAFQKSGAGHAAGSALEGVGAGVAVVPGLEGAGLGIAAAGAGAQRLGSASGASRSIQRRRARRATGQAQQPRVASQPSRGQRQAAIAGPATTTTKRKAIKSGTRTTQTVTRGGKTTTTVTTRKKGKNPGSTKTKRTVTQTP